MFAAKIKKMPSLRTTAIEFLISNAAVHNDGI